MAEKLSAGQHVELANIWALKLQKAVEAVGGTPSDILQVLVKASALSIYAAALDGFELQAANQFSKLVIGDVAIAMASDAPGGAIQ